MFSSFNSSLKFGRRKPASVAAADKSWTGTTTGLQLNLMNAPASGTTWTDLTGNGNVGTVRTIGSGTATYSSSTGGGLTVGSSINANAAMVSTAYNPTVPFTIEMVTNVTSTSFWTSLFGAESYTAGNGWLAYWGGATSFTAGSTSRINSYTLTANTGSTRHFVITVDATPSLKLYVNGVLQTPNSTGYNLTPTVANTGINFGSRHPNAGTTNTPNDCITGTHYQMRVYNIALNQTQVTANYAAVKSSVTGGYGLP